MPERDRGGIVYPVPVAEKQAGLAVPWRGGWYSAGAGLRPIADNPYLHDPERNAWRRGYYARKEADHA